MENDINTTELGFFHLYNGKINEAFNLFALDYEENNSSKSLNGMAFCYLANNNVPKMLETFKMAIEMNDTQSLIYLGNYYNSKISFDEMKHCYIRACFVDGISACKIARYYMSICDYESAIIYYMMSINKNNFIAMFELGELYELIYNKKKAIFFYYKIINNF